MMNKVPLTHLFKDSIQEDILFGFCEDASINLEIAYISDFRNAIFLREIADILCKKYGVHPKWRTRIVLIVDELNNNAIEYGSKNGDINLFEFKLEKNSEGVIYITISVTDCATGENSKNAEQMKELQTQHHSKDFTKHHSIRGRGLFLIISRLVDSLSFSNISGKGLNVKVTKTLQEYGEM